MALNREQIIAARAVRKPVRLDVPEWGGFVFLKYLTVSDQVALSEDTKPADMPIAVLLAAVVDEEGAPIFLPEDAEELSKEAFAVVLRVFSEAAKLNGLSNVELEAAMANFGDLRSEPEGNGSRSLSDSQATS